MICFCHFSWGFIKIHGLKKIDISKNAGINFYYVNRYSIQLKREKNIYTYFVVAYIAFMIAIGTYISNTEAKGMIPPWGLFIGVLPLVYWSQVLYTPNYHKNIGSILKSLDEIRELKEE
jgi:hypothetical protein